MIANVKRPKEWNLADWLGVVSLSGLLATAAWQASEANSELRQIKALMIDQKQENAEFRNVDRDHEKRIIVLENRHHH